MVVYIVSSVTEVEHDWEAKDIIAVCSSRDEAERLAEELKRQITQPPGWGGVYTYEVTEHEVQSG